MTECKSCGAAILWCVTEQGKRMPVDTTPKADGNVLVFECAETGTDMCRVVSNAEVATWSADEPEHLQLHTSHFVTCPNAAAHRKKKP